MIIGGSFTPLNLTTTLRAATRDGRRGDDNSLRKVQNVRVDSSEVIAVFHGRQKWPKRL
jgi:hypothetical protein